MQTTEIYEDHVIIYSTYYVIECHYNGLIIDDSIKYLFADGSHYRTHSQKYVTPDGYTSI